MRKPVLLSRSYDQHFCWILVAKFLLELTTFKKKYTGKHIITVLSVGSKNKLVQGDPIFCTMIFLRRLYGNIARKCTSTLRWCNRARRDMSLGQNVTWRIFFCQGWFIEISIQRRRQALGLQQTAYAYLSKNMQQQPLLRWEDYSLTGL